MFRGTDRSRPLSKASKIGLLDQLGLILKKELLHSFRDRDVFLYTVLIPCLVYPFLSFVGVEFTLLTQSADKDKPLQVAYIEQEPGSSADAEVVKAYDFLQRAVKASKNKVELQPMAREKAMAALYRQDVSLVVGPPLPTPSAEHKGSAAVAVQPAALEGPHLTAYVGHSFDSYLKTEKLKDALDNFQRDELKRQFALKGLKDTRGAYGAKMVNLHPLKQESYSLHFVMLLVSVMMMGVGVCYPAITATTEEFERKTIESTMLLPVSRDAIIFAKLLSVCLFGVFTGAVNFFSILAVFALLIFTASQVRTIDINELKSLLTPVQVLLVSSSYLIMGLLLASLMMVVTSFCRTVRSAQNWVSIPMLLVMVLPAISLLPSLTLGKGLALVPFLGLALTIRQFFTAPTVSFEQYLALFSSLVYAVLLTGIAGRLMFEFDGDFVQHLQAGISGRKGGVKPNTPPQSLEVHPDQEAAEKL